MLKLDFLNVGDGDAILIRKDAQGFTMLVDAGRPFVEFAKGSRRMSALNHLMKERVACVDLLVLTHLHIDHIGGALEVLRHIPVRRMIAAYLPPEDAGWIDSPDSGEKTIVGLCDTLNMFRDAVADARARGVVCELAAPAEESPVPGLSWRFTLPDGALLARQKEMFDRLYHGGMASEDALYAISKDRNNSSLLLRLTYAGRSVLLTGDSYAKYWEDAPEPPCDILKVPHHGDDKSMTERLIARLHPEYAVVSCENNAVPKKERPAPFVMNLLYERVPHVLCTENREFPNFPAATNRAVRLEIHDDGSILCLEPSE